MTVSQVVTKFAENLAATSLSTSSSNNPYADLLRQFQEIIIPNKTTKPNRDATPHSHQRPTDRRTNAQIST